MANSYETKFCHDLIAKCNEGIVECKKLIENGEETGSVENLWHTINDLYEFILDHGNKEIKKLPEFLAMMEDMCQLYDVIFPKYDCGNPECVVCPN